jgi:hypothetical protein
MYEKFEAEIEKLNQRVEEQACKRPGARLLAEGHTILAALIAFLGIAIGVTALTLKPVMDRAAIYDSNRGDIHANADSQRKDDHGRCLESRRSKHGPA